MKVNISFNNTTLEGTIHNTPTGKAIYNALSLSGEAQVWGKEVYFTIPLSQNLEPDAKESVPIGGLAYIWSNGDATQSITTAIPGIYSVTIADPSGCQYIPDDINVSVEGVLNRKITATVLEDAAIASFIMGIRSSLSSSMENFSKRISPSSGA